MLWPRAPCIFSKKSCCGQRSVRVPPQNVGHRHIFGAKMHQTLATVRLSTPRMCSFLLIFCKCSETQHFLQYLLKIADENLRSRTAINMTFEKHRFLAWVPRAHFLQLIASEAPERYPKSPTSWYSFVIGLEGTFRTPVSLCGLFFGFPVEVCCIHGAHPSRHGDTAKTITRNAW